MSPGDALLDLDAALALTWERSIALDVEDVAADRCAGRILGRDVAVRRDHPAADVSAMDGFAVRSADLPGPLGIVGESRAGAPFAGTVAAGQATGISTGAVVPDGADAVLRVEDAVVEGGVVRALRAVEPGRDIRARGEDLARGDTLLREGTRLGAAAVGPLRTAGLAAVPCLRRPRVAILSSGDELVADEGPVADHQILDGNGPGLAAQVEAAGGEVLAVERVGDDRRATERAVEAMLSPDRGAPADLLVTVGGLSVGRHDHMGGALAAADVRFVVRGVAIRPGRPVHVGDRGAQRVLALPGTPASAALCFHVLGRPLLGHAPDWSRSAPLRGPVPWSSRQTCLVRCRSDGQDLVALDRQGASDVGSLAAADALARVPPGEAPPADGARVTYQPLA